MNLYCYTDGSFSRKHKKGAYAFIVMTKEDNFDMMVKRADVVQNSTSQVSELTAVKECLKFCLDLCKEKSNNVVVNITSDSQYCVNGLNDWVYNWIASGWINTSNKPVANQQLWQDIYDLKQKFKNVNMKWVKGHIGVQGNEIVDKMCFALTRE